MDSILIRNALHVNEGEIKPSDILVRGQRIERIDPQISIPAYRCEEIDAMGKHLLPGVIDDQVHFREPGLTHKGDIYTESRAAVAGGVTSFMEMPNTKPETTTQVLLEEKYALAAKKALANYSFFMGGTNTNLEELLKTDRRSVPGIKLFMGSSTGNMLVDDDGALDAIFSQCSHLIAIHSESEPIIRANLEKYKDEYGENIPMEAHPLIRSVEACYASTEKATALAKKHGTRLHVLHISTEEELALFDNKTPLLKKKLTAEACVHHLWFSSDDYERLGGQIKCNPAIKEPRHGKAVFQGLLDNKIDIIASDHAPHTWEEKQQKYLACPSGLPLVQHGLLMMLQFYRDGKISLPKMVEKMSHAVADCFGIEDRGYLREGYYADLVLAHLNRATTVSKKNLYYKCGWSPFEGYTFPAAITTTIVSGHIAWQNGEFREKPGERLRYSTE